MATGKQPESDLMRGKRRRRRKIIAIKKIIMHIAHPNPQVCTFSYIRRYLMSDHNMNF